MKTCPKCNATLDDSAAFCTTCGNAFAANYQQPGYNQNQGGTMPPPNYAQAPYDPFDHTAEFDPKDISDNKVISMLLYLPGTSLIAVIIALLASNNSPYCAFHVRQALKFMVAETLLTLCSAILCWTFIVPIAGVIMIGVLAVIKIICFFQICSGKAKEPAIIRSLGFLK